MIASILFHIIAIIFLIELYQFITFKEYTKCYRHLFNMFFYDNCIFVYSDFHNKNNKVFFKYIGDDLVLYQFYNYENHHIIFEYFHKDLLHKSYDDIFKNKYHYQGLTIIQSILNWQLYI